MSPIATRPPSCLVISSQLVSGGVGGRISLFSLERCGITASFIPTILLPWHPGQGMGSRLVYDHGSFQRLLDDICVRQSIKPFDAVITGYFAKAAQVEASARLVDAVKRQNPDCLFACDPILGDEGRIYVGAEIISAIQDHLLPLADIATPNLFELACLSKSACDTETKIIQAARKLGPQKVLVTSAPARLRGKIANLLISPRAVMVAENTFRADIPKGTGDMICAVFVAGLLKQLADIKALRLAVAAVDHVVAGSGPGAEDLEYVALQQGLAAPQADIALRHISAD